MPKPDLLSLHVRRGYRTPFIGVTFDEHSLFIELTTALRKAWLLRLDDQIGADSGNNGLMNLLDFLTDTPDKELVELRDDDTENVHTLQRDTIYAMWNHVFYPMSSFLVNINCNTGIFRPPAHGSLDIRFPEAGEEGEMVKVAEFSNDTHFLILPAFIEPGIKVHVKLGDEAKPIEQTEWAADMTGFVFDATETEWVYLGTDIYWVKAGQTIAIHVNRKASKTGRLAAVLVYGEYDDNFAESDDQQHMQSHRLYDYEGDDALHEKIKQTRWGGTGCIPDERELCSEITTLSLWEKNNGNQKCKEENDEEHENDEKDDEKEEEEQRESADGKHEEGNELANEIHITGRGQSRRGPPSVITVLSLR